MIFIRSQNRETLMQFGTAYSSLEYNQYLDFKQHKDKKFRHVICISNGCSEEIGEYESKERCLEILDEITKLCGSYLYLDGEKALVPGQHDRLPFVAIIPHVYQMPEH